MTHYDCVAFLKSSGVLRVSAASANNCASPESPQAFSASPADLLHDFRSFRICLVCFPQLPLAISAVSHHVVRVLAIYFMFLSMFCRGFSRFQALVFS